MVMEAGKHPRERVVGVISAWSIMRATPESITTCHSTSCCGNTVKKNGRHKVVRENTSSGSLGTTICDIPLKLPSLNEYIRACRSNKFQGSKMKRETEDLIGAYIKDLPQFLSPVEIEFHWVESSKRRDLDNVAFSKKFILDALVKFGKLKDDNRKCVTAFRDVFSYSTESHVILTIKEVGNDRDETSRRNDHS
jgi:Holliday junction resolvase RusA-like endonuclease